MDIIINTLQKAAALTSLNTGSHVETSIKNVADGVGQTQTPVVSANAATAAKNAANVKLAVSQLNNHVQAIQRNLQFSVDHGTMVVKIVDTQSNQVIQQIPTEAALNLAQALTAEDNKTAFNLFSSKA